VKQATNVCFLQRAVVWFDGKGITCKRVLSDNSTANRSKPWRDACSALGLKPKRTRMCIPRTNDKAEQLIKTLLAEWSYSRAFKTSLARNNWAPRCLAIYNGLRHQMALTGSTPIQQLGWLRTTG
jgi:transposase InsO family protein